jgi:hypothetical protein
MREYIMKKTCTVFLVILTLTSCAKKMSKSLDDTIDRSFASENSDDTLLQTLKASSGTQSFITVSVDQNFIIPYFIKSTKGKVTNQVARVYVDYSIENSTFGYYCRYLPHVETNEFIFDNCFINEAKETAYDLDPNSNSQLIFGSGYKALIHPEHSVALEVINNQSLSSIDVQVQVELLPVGKK